MMNGNEEDKDWNCSTIRKIEGEVSKGTPEWPKELGERKANNIPIMMEQTVKELAKW